MSSRLSGFSVPNPVDVDEGNDDDHLNSSVSPAAGVKKDLSVLSQTFSRRLRGVSDFVAPPPTSSSQLSHQAPRAAFFCGGRRSPSSKALIGIKNDLSEIGGSFKSLLSSSSNIAATGLSKFARYFLQFPDGSYVVEDDYRELEDVPGIDEKVVGFAREVSSRPELWSDFPLSLPNGEVSSLALLQHLVLVFICSAELLLPSVPFLCFIDQIMLSRCYYPVIIIRFLSDCGGQSSVINESREKFLFLFLLFKESTIFLRHLIGNLTLLIIW